MAQPQARRRVRPPLPHQQLQKTHRAPDGRAEAERRSGGRQVAWIAWFTQTTHPPVVASRSMAHIAEDLAVTLVDDRPGMLAKAIGCVSAAGINIDGYAEMNGMVHVL